MYIGQLKSHIGNVLIFWCYYNKHHKFIDLKQQKYLLYCPRCLDKYNKIFSYGVLKWRCHQASSPSGYFKGDSVFRLFQLLEFICILCFVVPSSTFEAISNIFKSLSLTSASVLRSSYLSLFFQSSCFLQLTLLSFFNEDHLDYFGPTQVIQNNPTISRSLIELYLQSPFCHIR